MLSGVHFPTSGSINFNNQELSGLYPHVICNMGIGRTFQIPRPFKRLSILENAALAGYFGNKQQITKSMAWSNAEEALELIGLGNVANDNVATLGAAGLKKLELAKALATKPSLLLADESLGGLDHSEMEQAAQMLKNIRDELGITIIWVEHIMGVLMKVVDRVMVLDSGKKIAEGSPIEITKNKQVIEVYLGSDAVEISEAAKGRG
jgi:branched-chain amino acid transport system ATP-binding protein